MASALLRERLPPGCHIGVTQDGRVFFINDIKQTTSWLHPATGEPVLTGLQPSPDIPPGWEQDSTTEGEIYFINHRHRVTTFIHPCQQGDQQPRPLHADSPLHQPQSPTSPHSPSSPTLERDGFKRGTFKQRSVKAPTAKRNPNSEVVKSGWLSKLESGGLSKSKTWKKRWAVLADFALFLYKSEEEVTVVSSILLPGYKINPCTQEDNIKRNFVFKVEHENTKSVYFGTEDSPELVLWMSLLRQASMMNGQTGFQREPNNNYRRYPSKEGHIPNQPPNPNSLSHHPSFQNLHNFRPYQQKESPTDHNDNNVPISHLGQSPSYQGYNNDPASSPVGSPTETKDPPRIGGVYPFINMAGQRQSYVSQASSNRNSYAHQAPDSRGYPDQGRGPDRDSNLPPPQNQQRWQDDLEDRYRPNDSRADLSGHRNFPHNQFRPLRDGFAPDSVRSSLAPQDQRNSFVSGPHNISMQEQSNNRLSKSGDYVDFGPPDSGPYNYPPKNDYPSSRDPHHDPGKSQGFTPQELDLSRQSSSYGRDPRVDSHPGSRDSFPHNNVNPGWRNPNPNPHQQSLSLPGRGKSDDYIQGNLSLGSNDDRFRQSPQQQPSLNHGNYFPGTPEQDRRSFTSSSSMGKQPSHHHQHLPQQQQQQHSSNQNNHSFLGDTHASNQLEPPHTYKDMYSHHAGNEPRFHPGQRESSPHQSSFQPNTSHIPNSSSQGPQSNPFTSSTDSNTSMDQSNPHTYVNFPSHQAPPPSFLPVQNTSRDSSFIEQPPSRPPYPAEMRHHIVEEIAKVQTPSTQRDFLTSAMINQQRMQQPAFFQYPSPRHGQDYQDHRRDVNMQSSSAPRDTSRFSTASRGSQGSRGGPGGGGSGGSQRGNDGQSMSDVTDTEARQLRAAYQRVNSFRSSPDKVHNFPADYSLDYHKGNDRSSERFDGNRKLSPTHRGYKSQDELDELGKTPPPTGSYHRIPDDSENLYQRGSAFRPPSSMSGSQTGSESLFRMKRKFPSTNALSNYFEDKIGDCEQKYEGNTDTYHERSPFHNYYNIRNEGRPGMDHSDQEPSHRTDSYQYPCSSSYHPTRDDHSSHNQQKSGDREYYHDNHPFFDPYGHAKNVEEMMRQTKSEEEDYSRPVLLAAPPRRKAAPIQTVKEDPDMPDRDVLETDLQKVAAKNPLNGPRLRMSISAADLIGKTHDELVLLLIQLRRNQSTLDKTREFYRTQIDQMRPVELEYRRQVHQSGHIQDVRVLNAHRMFVDAKTLMEEVENKLEVYRPIINLLDNMVTMGSLYGGDNLMLATQYRKHLLRPDQYQPTKKMLEFSRKQQEERLINETHEDIKQLSKDEVDLEDKIDRLNEVDRLVQEQSFKVSSFREDKELMEKALVGILRQQDQNRHNPHEMRRLTQQQRMLEKEISRVTQQLAEASKELEETTAENNKLEHEIALLRTKVHGELSRSRSAPSLASENIRTKMKMEKELAKVQDMMQGLNQKGAKLSQAMNTLRRSASGSNIATALEDSNDQQSYGGSGTGTYLQTDLDSGEQIDLSKSSGQNGRLDTHPPINHHRQNAADNWDIDKNDEDTKKFFGLLARDKPKGQTVRDVKRLSEARKEKDKRSDEFGEEISLRVSNVDNEVSSIIHARIAKDNQAVLHSSNRNPSWDSNGQPLYENLPRYGSMPALAHSNNINNNNNIGNNSNNSVNNGNNQSAASSRRSSIVLLTPKPFVPYQDKSARPFRSELNLNLNNNTFDNTDNSMSAVNDDNNNSYFNRGKNFNLDRPYHSQDLLASDNNGQGYLNAHSHRPFKQGSRDYSFNQKQDDAHQSQQLDGQFHARPTNIFSKDATNDGHYSPIIPTSVAGQMAAVPGTNGGLQLSQKEDARVQQPRLYAPRPWGKSDPENYEVKPWKPFHTRHNTISSSQPFKMEANAFLNPTIHSSAGDLILNRSIDDVPDIVKSSQGKMDQIDGDIIDREILSVPDKVLIPERYDAEADAEDLTEDEKLMRQERAERIKKVLASQSVMSLSQPDISSLPTEEIHSRIQKEKKERAHFLALNQELARQVTQQSKKQAAERRKTWSGAQFADAKKQYEQEMLNSSGSPLRSPDPIRKRSGLTLHSP